MHAFSMGFVLSLAFFGLADAAAAQDASLGAAGAVEFRISCAACHGEHARGDGPMAELLKVKPADLTQLAKHNHGAFPFLKVFETIDGRAAVKAHGSRAMPIWGDRFQAGLQEKFKLGSETVRKAEIETLVRARILELIYYLQTIQQN